MQEDYSVETLDISELRNEIKRLRLENEELKRKLSTIFKCTNGHTNESCIIETSVPHEHMKNDLKKKNANGLSKHEILRYSRQLLIPEIGVKGKS